MIVVKIELWPGGSFEKRRPLGRMYITNSGRRVNETNGKRADYGVRLMRKSAAGYGAVPAREGIVLDHARNSYSIWKLVARALRSVGFEP